MNGLWLADGRLRHRADLEAPPRASGEARVRVLLAGVCGTDLALVDGLYPFEGVPGHEFVGIVEDGPAHLDGRRVVGEINVACGSCPECVAGLAKHCRRRSALGIRGRNGAFAELVSLPVVNLHPVPDGIASDDAVFVEPLAAALDILERVPVDRGEKVLVVGAGRLGQLVCRVLAAHGARVVAVGRHPRKLALLDGIVAGIVDAGALEPRSFRVAVECTGNPLALPLAQRALAARGTLVVKSTCAGTPALDLTSLVVDELTVTGSRCGPFDKALRLLASGSLDLRPLIDARYPLADGVEAFARSRRPGVMKVLVDVGAHAERAA